MAVPVSWVAMPTSSSRRPYEDSSSLGIDGDVNAWVDFAHHKGRPVLPRCTMRREVDVTTPAHLTSPPS
jgi:hypothetical protein